MALEPAVASEPVQPPEAVHAVALVEDQLSVVPPPLATVLGLEVIETVGAAEGAPALTATVAVWVALPPGPVHVKVYVAVAFSAPVDFEPLVDTGPFQAPEPPQAVAFVELQASIAD